MSIFKKLLGVGKSERVHTLRPPRVRITTLHRVLFRQLVSGKEACIPVGNISTQGMGLLRAQAKAPALGQRIEGELEVNDSSFKVASEVRHLGDAIVGCQFVGAYDPLSRAIEEYFRVEICALQLYPVDEAYLKHDPAGQVRWFTDGKQNEVYFVADGDGILTFHVSFLGNYIEGGRGKVLRCGHVIEDLPSTKHKGSSLLDLSPQISEEVLRLSHQLIDSLESLPAAEAGLLKALLKKQP